MQGRSQSGLLVQVPPLILSMSGTCGVRKGVVEDNAVKKLAARMQARSGPFEALQPLTSNADIKLSR